ncbi:MAG: sterol desaturase family protein [Deltaproteobacteria bacterium]|nr:sterol desaturase family protein [Deltaproteobacteria bacterium]
MIAETIGLLLAGFLFWGLLEYTIHGLLAHRWKTFVSPLHWNHHRDPRNVFTTPIAVVPITLLLFGATTLVASPLQASCFVVGVLAGFSRYEWMHWRFHFRESRNNRGRLLRSHHLAHHFCNPRIYHGVSTRFWDRVFGTLPAGWEKDYARVAERAPLEGRSNFIEIWNPKTSLAHLRRAMNQRQ